MASATRPFFLLATRYSLLTTKGMPRTVAIVGRPNVGKAACSTGWRGNAFPSCTTAGSRVT